MTDGRRPAFAIIGPTAVGKTRAGFELARRVGAEIISVDSRQVYRYLDVGTDKISAAERKIIPHHLIDVADPDEIFTVADFVAQTGSAMRRISARGRIPLLVGGTPMYYRALEGNMLSESLPSDKSVRRELEEEANLGGNPALHARLAAVDPESAERIHPNDRVRTVRALEIYALSGRTATELYSGNKKIGAGASDESNSLKMFYFGFNSPRKILYERIARRVAEQFASGYPEEVKWLLDNGYRRNLPALRGFGYRELVMFLDGLISFEEALQGDIKSTKAFARRQMTWFKHFSPIVWYDLSAESFERAVGDMEKIITGGDRIVNTESGRA
ncbi:MAG: tRNA (adenosine(37)-N6)-dimethylallyltransferase MiaA [Synergistaceae bacterium]|jgi:tRNA dimethylallyltransferase|nr:tRNA (adenosine(37)-N6)-dimethylallyltransferase MiaA [Synergistaceae bacterium]